MYVRTYEGTYVFTYVSTYVCRYVRMWVRTYVGMYGYLNLGSPIFHYLARFKRIAHDGGVAITNKPYLRVDYSTLESDKLNV